MTGYRQTRLLPRNRPFALLTVLVGLFVISADGAEGQPWLDEATRKAERGLASAKEKAREAQEVSERESRRVYDDTQIRKRKGEDQDGEAGHIRRGVSRIIERDRHSLEASIYELRRALQLSAEDYRPPSPPQRSSVPNPTIRDVIFPPVAKAGKPIYIRVVAENLGAAARQGGITLAFPDTSSLTVFQAGSDSTTVSVYPPGDELYSAALQRKITATYPVVETYSWTSISHGATYEIETFVVPKEVGTFRFQVRTALRGSGRNFHGFPADDTYPTDQQKWPVLEYKVIVQ